MTVGILPALALSVRQPWAWAIVAAGKDIENRSWQAVNRGLKWRGRVCVQAAKGLTKDEYEDGYFFMRDTFGIRCPPAADLVRGAIIGSVEVVDVVSKSESKWFFGPRGLVLRDAEFWSPIPCLGALGYFEWKRADQSVMPPAAKWMLAPKPKQEKAIPEIQERML